MPNDQIIKNSKILVVDDEPANVLMLERLLDWAGYQRVTSLTDPRKVKGVCDEIEPDIVLLDLHMPGLNGYEVLTELRKDQELYVPVLVFTADITSEARNKALQCGANDFLTKPGDSMEILLRVRNFLETRHLHKWLKDQNAYLEQRVLERTHDLERSRLDTLERLARAADYRDDQTGAHTRRVGTFASAMAKLLNSPDADPWLLEMGAPLHDIGKIGIPDSVLLKPGPLTPDEFEIMKTHTTIGAELLSGSESDIFVVAETIALRHHEKWDGSGYPGGLAGTEIPLVGRIVAVADVFDALTHERPYKRAWSVRDTVDEIAKNAGRHFDPDVVEAFMMCLEDCGLDRAA